jgi:Carbohydrate esterase, sialic acid-specific acetylesterase
MEGTGGSGGADSSGDAGVTDGAEPFDGLELFLLFGQSNMSGSAAIEAEDEATNERIEFMVQYDCPSLDQTYGEWLVASPPLHGCQWAGATTGLGPADSFAKAIAEAWPDSKIGLVPCAVPGVSIDYYEKGAVSRGESYQALPEDYTSAYQMMLDRAQAAQQLGRIRGILFHQGESDSGQQVWLGKVADVVENLRTDLGIGEEVPFIAGELPPTACCGGHNTLVNQIPDTIPNSAVATAEGTTIHDQYHWDSASVRLMGNRYADAFLELVPQP